MVPHHHRPAGLLRALRLNMSVLCGVGRGGSRVSFASSRRSAATATATGAGAPPLELTARDSPVGELALSMLPLRAHAR
eukprot:SAG25_NODE_272_length_10613_cov_6.416191_9_plen_79_part_00